VTRDEFEAVYRLAFEAGVQVGYGRRCAEEEAEWTALAAHGRKHARMRTCAETQQARQEAV